MQEPAAIGWLRAGPLERGLALANLVSALGALAMGGALGALLVGHASSPAQYAGFGAAAAMAVAAGVLLHRRLVAGLAAPVREIERTLAAVERGEFRARARLTEPVDAGLARATASLNLLLAAQLADRQRLRDVAARAFRAQEAERLRIARELQEEAAQALTTVLFRLRAARQTADADDRERQLDEVRDDLMRTTDSIRGYARTLHPPSLQDLGLIPALEGYARALASSSGLTIRILADQIHGVLPIQGELALYRIVQEALGNVARHARASQVLVRVRIAGDLVKTLVQDDGRGFLVDDAEARLPCLGLFGMRERALSVGGTVEIDSIPGDGTQVRIAIPAAAHPTAAPTAPWPVIVRSSEPPDPAPPVAGDGAGPVL